MMDNDNDNCLHHLHSENIFCQTYSKGYLKRNLTNTLTGHDFSIVHFNVRSFTSNFDEFSILLEYLKWQPEVLVLSETWFAVDSCYDIPGYVGHHVYRADKRGGGVSIFVKDSIDSTPH